MLRVFGHRWAATAVHTWITSTHAACIHMRSISATATRQKCPNELCWCLCALQTDRPATGISQQNEISCDSRPHVSAIGHFVCKHTIWTDAKPNQTIRCERRRARIRTEPNIKWMDAEIGNGDSRDSRKTLRFVRSFFSSSSAAINQWRQWWRLTPTAFAHFRLIRQRSLANGAANAPPNQLFNPYCK